MLFGIVLFVEIVGCLILVLFAIAGWFGLRFLVYFAWAYCLVVCEFVVLGDFVAVC